MTLHRLFATCLITSIALTSMATVAAQPKRAQTAPEAFVGSLQAKTEAGATGSDVRIQIDRYLSDAERKTAMDALTRGFPAFVQSLRGGKQVGHVEVAKEKFPIRFAMEQSKDKGRTITLVTDTPIYFVGGGRRDAKPREGFEIAVVQLTVDDYGMGFGTMAAAARVKADGAGGVQLEDYAENPIRVTFVHREIK